MEMKVLNGSLSSSSDARLGNSGPHREMAVDCPASFIPVKKEPPRLPRSSVVSSPSSTLTKNKTSSSNNNNNSSSNGNTMDSSHNIVNNNNNFDRGDDRDRSERLRRYQQDLLLRQQMQQQQHQQQQVLRASLRGSKKMQGLEESRRQAARTLNESQGFDNPNYHVDDIEMDVDRTLVKRPDSQDNNIIISNMSKFYSVCLRQCYYSIWSHLC